MLTQKKQFIQYSEYAGNIILNGEHCHAFVMPCSTTGSGKFVTEIAVVFVFCLHIFFTASLLPK